MTLCLCVYTVIGMIACNLVFLLNCISSLYSRQEEMEHSCRGTVILTGAIIDRVDRCHFMVTNGPSQVFHLRASDEVERDKWVTALKLVQEHWAGQ